MILDLFSKEAIRPPATEDDLGKLRQTIRGCTACPLRRTATQPVPGEGNVAHPEIAFIGEAPGVTDDAKNKLMAGTAGEVFFKMLGACEIDRAEPFICNAANCFSGRTPTIEELAQCRSHLVAQLRLIAPKVIVCLGSSAAQSLLKYKRTAVELRGEWFQWEGIPVRVTFHPAWLLKSPPDRVQAMLDMTAVLRKLGRPDPKIG